MIDASIPLASRGIGPLANPMEVMQQAQQMRLAREQSIALAESRRASAAQQQAQTAKLQRDAEREAAGGVALDELFSTYEPGKPIPMGPVASLYKAYGSERASAIVKGLADFSTADLTNAEKLRESMLKRIGALKALPEDRRASAYDAVVKDYTSKGVLKPEEVAPYSPTVLDDYEKALMTPAQRDTHAAAAAALPGVIADSTVKGQVAAGTVGGITPAQAADAARATATAQESARHNRATEATARAAAAKASSEPLEAVIKDGKSILVPRSQAVGLTPATNRERTTEDERKSVGWYAQMRDASATIDKLEDSLSQKELYQIQTLPHEALVGMANRNALSENAKRYFRAFTQFSEARLRSVSGAAISSGEYQSDRQTYGKQFSETPTLAADRKRAREVVMQATRERAGVAMPKEAAAAGSAAAGMIRARDAQGQLHEAKAGTPLPAGWKLEGGG